MQNNPIVYLIRHGLDDETFIGGWSMGGLIEEGIKQVENATDFIFKSIDDINFVYHSGLKRTIETAEIINKRLNFQIAPLDSLKELNKGKLNGMELNIAKNIYPDFFPTPLIEQRYPNGESLQDLYIRVKLFLNNIDKYDKSLLVTHRGFINMIYFILNGIKINYDKRQFDVTHASIHKLESGKIKRIY